MGFVLFLLFLLKTAVWCFEYVLTQAKTFSAMVEASQGSKSKEAISCLIPMQTMKKICKDDQVTEIF